MSHPIPKGAARVISKLEYPSLNHGCYVGEMVREELHTMQEVAGLNPNHRMRILCDLRRGIYFMCADSLSVFNITF